MIHQAPSVARAVQTAVSEHMNLSRLVRQVEAAFPPDGRPHAGSGPDVVAARLDALCGPLRAHFEALGSGDFSPLWSGQNASCRPIPAAELTHQLAQGFACLL